MTSIRKPNPEEAYVSALRLLDDELKQREGFILLKSIAVAGYGPAMCALGNQYSAGIGTERNKTEAMRWWRRGAKKGGISSILNIGTEYRDFYKNRRRAMFWLRRAASLDRPQANLEMAKLYYDAGDARYRKRILCYIRMALLPGAMLSPNEKKEAEIIFNEVMESDWRK